jgi:MSHA biogenesis protein MshN
MSLINRMLQDLDARRSEVTGTGVLAQQIRAVAERRRVHPAWWVALVLAIALTAILSWLFLRPPVAAPSANTLLPLKLDLDLNLEKPAPVQDSAAADVRKEASPASPLLPPASEKTGDSAPMTTVPPSGASSPEVLAPHAVPATSPSISKPASASTPKPATLARTAKEVPSPPVPELAKVIPAVKSLAVAPAPKVPEAGASSGGNKQIKELSPHQRAENEYRKATQLIHLGKIPEAIGSLELALQLDVNHAAARQALIGMLLEQSRIDDALRAAREGMNLDPSQYGLAMILARLQLEKGDLRMAIETLERTLPYAADRADYQAFLAAMLQREGRHKQAAEHFILALKQNPQTGAWWMGLGISLKAERRVPEAQEAFKRAKATNTLSHELLVFVDAQLSQMQR